MFVCVCVCMHMLVCMVFKNSELYSWVYGWHPLGWRLHVRPSPASLPTELRLTKLPYRLHARLPVSPKLFHARGRPVLCTGVASVPVELQVLSKA